MVGTLNKVASGAAAQGPQSVYGGVAQLEEAEEVFEPLLHLADSIACTRSNLLAKKVRRYLPSRCLKSVNRRLPSPDSPCAHALHDLLWLFTTDQYLHPTNSKILG